MSPAARYLWHQRLAWLLMLYFAAIGSSIAPDFSFGGLNIGFCLSVLMICAMVMTCVKDSAMCGRPIPFAWRVRSPGCGRLRCRSWNGGRDGGGGCCGF